MPLNWTQISELSFLAATAYGTDRTGTSQTMEALLAGSGWSVVSPLHLVQAGADAANFNGDFYAVGSANETSGGDALVVWHPSGRLAIIFRGTDESSDIALDFISALSAGIGFTAYSLLFSDLVEAVFALANGAVVLNGGAFSAPYAGASVFTSGHSLGGVVAEYWWATHNDRIVGGVGIGSPGPYALPVPTNEQFIHVTREHDSIGQFLFHRGSSVLLDDDYFLVPDPFGGPVHNHWRYADQLAVIANSPALSRVAVSNGVQIDVPVLSFGNSPSLSSNSGGGFLGWGFNEIFDGSSLALPLLIEAFTGNDTVIGGSSSDHLSGGSGADSLDGRNGADWLYGGAGNDILDGGDGEDVLLGDADEDILLGNFGSDTMNGGQGNDQLFGADGNDTLEGGAGSDKLYGGAGNDVIRGDYIDLVIDGGTNPDGSSDNDVLILDVSSAPAAAPIDEASIRLEFGSRIRNIETIQIVGATGTAPVNPTPPDERPGYDDDFVQAGITGSGYRTFIFNLGAGNDRLELSGFTRMSDTTAIGGAGNDTAVLNYSSVDTFGTGLGLTTSVLANGLQIHTGRVGDPSNIDNNTARLVITEFENYIISGTGNGDSIITGAGNDIINGNAGNDVISAGAGADQVLGGVGDDRITGGDAEDLELHGGTGFDFLQLNRSSSAMSVQWDFTTASQTTPHGQTLSGFERFDLTLGSGGDFVRSAIAGTGYTVNAFNLGAGNDRLELSGFTRMSDTTAIGGAGNDTAVLNYSSVDTFGTGLGLTTSVLANGLQIHTGRVGEPFNIDNNTARLVITEFENYIISGTGNGDSIITGAGNDVINGNAGNDVISAGAGADQVFGGNGDDRITGGDASDLELHGGAGFDFLHMDRSLSAVAVQWDFTAASQTTQNGPTLSGFERFDLTLGSGGDFVRSAITGTGHTVNAFNLGSGDDRLELSGFTRMSDTTAIGGAGNDTAVLNYSSVDTFGTVLGLSTSVLTNGLQIHTGRVGEPSNIDNNTARLVITEFENYIISGTGNGDSIITGAGNDVINGNAGNDVISAGAGDDFLTGGTGNDILTGGDGADTADYSGATVAVTVQLSVSVSQNTSGAGFDTLSGIENLIGSAFGDTLSGDAAANLISGNDGNDVVQGMDGNDTLNGDAGDDALYAGGGHDAVNAGAGNDVVTGGDGDDGVSGGLGGDTLYGNAGNDGISGGAGIDILIGGTGTDNLAGGDDSDYLYGDEDNDTLSGENGNDVLIAGIGDDTLIAGDGFDYLYAGDGNDTMSAVSGTNVFIGEAGNDGMTGGTGRDYFYGGIGDDTMTGGADIDILIGEDGLDIMNGDAGNDYLYAGLGNDTLTGGDGVDFMLGEGGNDTLNGGRDVNYLYGGAGSDIFIQNFATGAGVDVISDFEYGTDRIRLVGGAVRSFVDVLANMTYNTANGFTVIQTSATTSIWLAGDVRTTITSASFEFTPQAEEPDAKADIMEDLLVSDPEAPLPYAADWMWVDGVAALEWA